MSSALKIHVLSNRPAHCAGIDVSVPISHADYSLRPTNEFEGIPDGGDLFGIVATIVDRARSLQESILLIRVWPQQVKVIYTEPSAGEAMESLFAGLRDTSSVS